MRQPGGTRGVGPGLNGESAGTSTVCRQVKLVGLAAERRRRLFDVILALFGAAYSLTEGLVFLRRNPRLFHNPARHRTKTSMRIIYLT